MTRDWWDGMRHGGYLAVPLNNEGNRALVQDLDGGDDVLWTAISAAEFRVLGPLFDQMNKAFMLSIGEYTGEVLYLKDVVDALEMAHVFEREHSGTPAHEAARKVAQAMATALEQGSYVEFDV